ncbi:DUF3137 domain-containing protein [Fretibacter rubidus]|uniref:DUF3137 domain-containing protein n=1 Tax=Fretibacter rubidus TaxID=570162 RepID=UPI00352ACA11
MRKTFGKRRHPPTSSKVPPVEADVGSNTLSEADFLARCRPKLDALEDIRVEKFAVFKRRKKLAIPTAAILTPVLGFIDYWLLMLQRSSDDGAAGLTLVVLGALWFWVTIPKRQYAKAYKTKILPEIARLFGDFTYDVKGKIPMRAMKPSGIVPGHSGYNSEDHFSGLYKGVSIDLSEIKLTKKSGKRTVTVFNGLAVLLSGGTKPFSGHTIIVKDKTSVGAWAKAKISGLKRANFVDLEFERMFDVFTTDQTEARYLIDPVIMENLKVMQGEFNGDSLTASFYDDHVLILIESSTNHFEPAKIDIPATDETELMSLRDEIAQILSIVDQLSLLSAKNKRLHAS